EMNERVGALGFELGAHPMVADIHLDEARARPLDGRRLHVEVHDLGVLALGQQLDQTSADVARASRDEVLHPLPPRLSSPGRSFSPAKLNRNSKWHLQ